MNINTNTKFIDPQIVLFQAGLKAGQTVADLGAGSGFYALAAAKIVGNNGQVYVLDVKDQALDHLTSEARMRGVKTIKTYLADLDQPALPNRLPLAESDMAVLSNIMHEVGHPKTLLNHAYSLLKTGGRLLVVDWNNQPGPIGPVADRRIAQGEAKKLIESTSFKYIKDIDTDQYHFGMLFEK